MGCAENKNYKYLRGIMSEGLSEYQKDKFLKYLNDRLSRKQSEKKQYTAWDRTYDLLKTEIAELEVIKITFEKIISD